jgi:hypothetical protein
VQVTKVEPGLARQPLRRSGRCCMRAVLHPSEPAFTSVVNWDDVLL